jgi:apolipoprotein N-acyltransferase
LGPIGNPVGTIGYGIIDIIPLPNVAAMGGVYLVSFLVVLINAMLADIVFRRGLGKLVTCFAIFMVVGVWIGFSEIRQMTYTVNADLNPVSIALIQGNHAQMDKFNRRQWATIKEDYLRLTEVALQSSPDIVLWPETITPTLNLEDPLFVSVITRLSHENGSSIVWGTPIRKGSLFYNSIAAVTPGGILPGYLKIKLMPFGEYWPCRPALKAMGLTALLGDDYTGGSQCTLLPLAPTITVGGVICLESLYPWYTRTEAAAGAQLLVVIANNAWFIHSSAAQKHFQMTRMRAIETNRWVALCSNTGVTALVNPLGQPTETLPEDTQGVLHGTATRNRGLTPYTRYGDWIIGLSLMLCIGSGFLRKFRS